MRVTLDIEDSKLDKVLKETGETKKSPAISRAIEEFLKARERRRYVDMVLAGGTDYSSTNDEIEAMFATE